MLRKTLVCLVVFSSFFGCGFWAGKGSRTSAGSSRKPRGGETHPSTSAGISQGPLDPVDSITTARSSSYPQPEDSLPRELLPLKLQSGLDDSKSGEIVPELADSLLPEEPPPHQYLVKIDSLALSALAWPESLDADSTGDDRTEKLPPFPAIRNKRIDFWISYYKGPGKELFSRSLYRMERHRETIEQILEELDLPKDLICVPLIESGFYMRARSRARAVGPWQFVRGTAKLYGLRVNWWLDERRDIVASTYAAGNYLKNLYSLWESWLLALAAYNAGEYRVARAVAKQKTTDFWRLKLPRQTERYVPKFLAALSIARDPESYGFSSYDAEETAFDAVTVNDATDLKLIAKFADTSVEIIKELNPAILRWCTPPKTELAVKVPKGSAARCSLRLSQIPPEKRVTWRRHRIRKGETLSEIADKYGTRVSTLKKLNGIRNPHVIRAGRSLIVPQKGYFAELASTKPLYKSKRRKISKEALESYAKKSLSPPGYKRVYYVVKDYDTLGEIAELFGTSARKLRLWNNLSYRSYIYPGQKLKAYVPKSFDTTRVPQIERGRPSENGYVKKMYTVRRGDTIAAISKRFNVKVSDLLAWNNKSSRALIRPGETLEIWQKSD